MLLFIKTVQASTKFQAPLPYLAWISLPCITRLHKTRLRRSIILALFWYFSSERELFLFHSTWGGMGNEFFDARGLISRVSAEKKLGIFSSFLVFLCFWGGVFFCLFFRALARKKCFFGGGMSKTGSSRSVLASHFRARMDLEKKSPTWNPA